MSIPQIPGSMFRDGTKQELTPDQEELKRDLYERIPPRRRRFIDRIGYDNWDPFPKPNEPFELRTDVTKRTTQELIRDFMQSRPPELAQSNAYRQGALECALGIINHDEKIQGSVDFVTWYLDLLKKEGFGS